MSMTILVLVDQAHQQPSEENVFWIIVESLLEGLLMMDDGGISFGSCQAIFTDVLGMKRAAAKIITKFLNFLGKITSHGNRPFNVDNV